MTARVSFGFRGWYLPLILGFMSNMVFFGLQAYYGGLSFENIRQRLLWSNKILGQAISLMLGSMSPSYLHMANTLPAR
jgi:nucleobase:cation symporter-1, NCS1 family